MEDLNKHIAQLREDFMRGTLDDETVEKNPFLQFQAWLKQAVEAKVPELQAMTLSTVANNKPSTRVVYLREFEAGNFWFYGNYTSRKAQQLNQNPNACLNFFWPALERQIRIEGVVKIAASDLSDNYFRSRPRESQIGAWASNQSSALNSRKELEERVEHFEKEFEGKDVPRPHYWGGWMLEANYYEFWQGRKSRLHDRISYYQTPEGSWQMARLAP